MIELQREKHEIGKKPEERTVEELLRWGIVPIDKPIGPSSHEVSSFVRKILNVKKSGHTGTLDANVSGVLPVLLEESVKVNWWLAKGRKKYVCLMRWEKPVSESHVEAEAFSNLRGKIYQTPPAASAVAKKLRVREVYDLQVLEHRDRFTLFETEVEAGTYVRNMVFDAGELLGVKTDMLELRRTLAAGIKEAQSVTLQELSDRHWLWKEQGKEKPLREAILPIERAIPFKRVVISDGALSAVSHGAPLAIPGVIALDPAIEKSEHVQVLSGKGELVAIGEAQKSSEEISTQKHGLAVKVERVIHSF